MALQYAEDEQREDPEICLAAVKEDGRALQFCEGGLSGNHEIAVAAVERTGGALQSEKGCNSLYVNTLGKFHQKSTFASPFNVFVHC